jgi:hypothetical protein
VIEIQDDVVAGKWYITTETFKRGGRVVLGPFPTREDAIAMREQVERHTGDVTYWVEQAPNVMVKFSGEVQSLTQ